MHPEAADKRFRVWISKLNRALYGRRWYQHGQGVRWVRALELQRRGVIHFHVLLGGADVGELRRLSWMDEWDELAGFARIEAPRRDEAVRRYCSKAKYTSKGGEVDLGGRLDAPAPHPTLWFPQAGNGAPGASQPLPRGTREPQAPPRRGKRAKRA